MLATSIAVAAIAHSIVPAQQAETSLLINPRNLPNLNLINARTGAAFGTAQLTGRWTLVYSGYLNCPDLCPTTLGLFARLNAQLRLELANRSLSMPQFAFVSIDHFRDSAQSIAAYTNAFDRVITPLTGPPGALQKTTAALGFIAPPGRLQANVGHSSAIALIGPNTQLRALFRYPHNQTEIIATLLPLLATNRSPDVSNSS